MFLLEKLPREEAKATDEAMGMFAQHFMLVYDMLKRSCV